MNHERKPFTAFPQTYRELVEMYRPRTIHSDAECDAATAIAEKMAGHQLNADQEDYFDLLSTLIEQYDEVHHAIKTKPMSPIEALNYLLEENGMSASDLGRLLGNRELGSKILRGDRGLSLAHIATLSQRFSLSPEIFMPKAAASKSRKQSKPKGQWRNQAQTKDARAKR